MTNEEKIAEYRKKHFGECVVANCGMKMFIIAYRNNDDIDVVFQDGTIVTNKRYKNFTKGKIANPNIGLGLRICDRIGEVQDSSRCGKMIIINYLNANDIIVQFDSGDIVTNKSYQRFCCGYISKPITRIGETAIASNGEEMKIIAYRKSNDIDVQFKDGTIVTGVKYDSFLKGLVRHPNKVINILDSRVGEVRTANCGQQMTIIKYRSCQDIDVQFEDGTIVQHKRYEHFKSGNIINPHLKKTLKNQQERLIGEVAIASNGQEMKIIAYRAANDIDVQFEDGTIVCCRAYSNFKRGDIANPSIQKKKHKSKIGETAIANCGLKMTIVGYSGYKKVDVQFEDGVIVTNKTYDCFKSGAIAHPAHSSMKGIKHKKKRSVNRIKEKLQKNGQIAKIIEYRSYIDVDIIFEDGTVLHNVRYDSFLNGSLKNLNKPSNRVGERNIANNGMEMTIVAYRNADDIDVKFEDGTLVQHKSYQCFKDGKIAHPNLYKYKTCSFTEFVFLYYLRKIGFNRMPNGYFKKFNSDFGNRELDMFNEELMCGVEYDGCFFHNKNPKKDVHKNTLCKNSGITLIRIREAGLNSLNNKDCVEVFRTGYRVSCLVEDINNVVKTINTLFGKNFVINVDYKRDCPKIRKEYSNYVNHKNNPRIGETVVAKNKLKATIIAYTNSNNMSVQFEDGVVVNNVSYSSFKNGVIKHPTKSAAFKDRTGETSISSIGQKITIVKYEGSTELTVQFEDGTIIEHVSYQSFQEGHVGHPNISHRDVQKNQKIGERKLMQNGLYATIVGYRKYQDIDILFEDGKLYEHTSYATFKKGGIPSTNDRTSKLGATNVASNGQTITVIKYNNYHDFDVQFEDGTVVHCTSFGLFKNGHIKNPNFQKS